MSSWLADLITDAKSKEEYARPLPSHFNSLSNMIDKRDY
nr:MAG TPA: hypothetical protein [Caudoviricetes sp.]